jgi:hypothetical protein
MKALSDLRHVAAMSGAVLVVMAWPGALEARSPDECTFSRGTTACISVSQTTEIVMRQVFSGCLAGPFGVPGRRVRTFEDTYLVTTTTTTYRHGRKGRIYDTTSIEERQLQTSREVSSICEPI